MRYINIVVEGDAYLPGSPEVIWFTEGESDKDICAVCQDDYDYTFKEVEEGYGEGFMTENFVTFFDDDEILVQDMEIVAYQVCDSPAKTSFFFDEKHPYYQKLLPLTAPFIVKSDLGEIAKELHGFVEHTCVM